MGIAYNTSIVNDGLVLHLDAANVKSYPGTGNVWNDLSGKGNHFNLYNAPVHNSGYFQFNGTNNYARSSTPLDLSTLTAVTVLVWFSPLSYPSAGTLDFVYEHTNDFNSNTGGFVHTYNDTSLSQDYQIFLGNKGTAGYNISVWDKSAYSNIGWKHSVGVINRLQTSTENLLYVNGSLASALQNPAVGYSNDNTNSFANAFFYIGSRGGTSYYSDFRISAIQIYNRALSAAEIQQNFNALRGRYGI